MRCRELTIALSYSDFGSQISPFASRTFQYTKEQLGQAEDKVVRLTTTSLGASFVTDISPSRLSFRPTTSTSRSASMPSKTLTRRCWR